MFRRRPLRSDLVCCLFARRPNVATASSDKTVRLWTCERRDAWPAMPLAKGNCREPRLLPDGQDARHGGGDSTSTLLGRGVRQADIHSGRAAFISVVWLSASLARCWLWAQTEDLSVCTIRPKQPVADGSFPCRATSARSRFRRTACCWPSCRIDRSIHHDINIVWNLSTGTKC